MEKVDWKKLRIKFPVGQLNVEKDISLEPGKRIVAAAIVSKDPGQLLSIGLFENGNEISAPMDRQFWKKSNAGLYLDGFKPIEFKGGSTITARLETPAALAAEVDVEIVFGIIKDDTTC